MGPVPEKANINTFFALNNNFLSLICDLSHDNIQKIRTKNMTPLEIRWCWSYNGKLTHNNGQGKCQLKNSRNKFIHCDTFIHNTSCLITFLSCLVIVTGQLSGFLHSTPGNRGVVTKKGENISATRLTSCFTKK